MRMVRSSAAGVPSACSANSSRSLQFFSDLNPPWVLWRWMQPWRQSSSELASPEEEKT